MIKIKTENILFIKENDNWKSFEKTYDIENNPYYQVLSNNIYTRELKDLLEALLKNEVKVKE